MQDDTTNKHINFRYYSYTNRLYITSWKNDLAHLLVRFWNS